MKRRQTHICSVALRIVLAWALVVGMSQTGGVYAEAQSGGLKIQADAFVAWWMHDATGYHPAIYLILQNTSGTDLSWKPIKFQGLFRDVKNGYVTVARDEITREFPANKQLYLLLEGPKAFELPIDQASWPSIECKVMCRAGNVDDDSITQDIIVTKLEGVAMTDEEALAKLMDYSHPHMIKQHRAERVHAPTPLAAGEPLLSLSDTHHKPVHNDSKHESINHLLSGSHVAGLGDDYYEFEQAFGRPVESFYTHDLKWTWAHYSVADPQMTIFAGARGHSSKVDFIVAILPAAVIQQDSQVLALGRALAGKLKSQPLSSPEKTVKYLNTGRIQLSTAAAPSYKLFYIAPRNSSADDNYVLGVSRIPGEPRTLLAENARRVAMLHLLSPILTDAEPD
jgi:hypothetical protein